MPLSAGARLGPFEIVSALGAGGMGEVYRARDTKLNRDVALKVIPDTFALDPDRVSRFKREAQVLASLNHPNIAAIHGLEEADGILALVLELVEGEDLIFYAEDTGIIRFTRNRAKNVDGFLVSTGRVRDVRFKRATATNAVPRR
jgi:serine/threonine protein kinase